MVQEFIVFAIVGVVLFFIFRSLWRMLRPPKGGQRGPGCTGCSGGCGGSC
ncbi:MAG: FeoB-associated Cys-rich membrane protein [Porphyromonadaceae bacterium]|nr:FeoB-associated Cys-rich membrane protein [uncultured Porphyromonas sp.]MBF1047343.1 FeoB-associated Cys-rich membrane protein [Porphyromonadaceae bacterium]